jgi:Kef-type K+ transport system membrane component KefB
MITLPQGLLTEVVFDSHFVARFSLYVAVLLIGGLLISKLLYRYLHVPVIAGQLIAGIVLGPTALNVNAWGVFGDFFNLVDKTTGQVYQLYAADMFAAIVIMISSAVTVSYLLWMAGHETDIAAMKKVGFLAICGGVLGAIVPIVMNGAHAYFSGYATCGVSTAIGLGLIFAATSVSIPVAMLIERKKMHLRSSQATLGAAVVDDIVAVVLVSLFLVGVQGGAHAAGCYTHPVKGLIISLVRMFGSLVGLSLVGYYAMTWVARFLERVKLEHLMSVIGFCVMLLFFSVAELIGGLAGITGAYFAGLFHQQADKEHGALTQLTPFVQIILMPLFLISIGLQVNMRVLDRGNISLIAIMTLLAVVSKFIGMYLSVWLNNLRSAAQDRWSMQEAYLFGASMVARGEVGLVIGTLLRGSGVIGETLHVASVLALLFTTIVTPILLSKGFSNAQEL